jgi:hypothetical protein
MSADAIFEPLPDLLAQTAAEDSGHLVALDRTTPFDHRVQFYEQDGFLYDAIAEFFSSGVQDGEALVVIATESHRVGLRQRLEEKGVDVDGLAGAGTLAFLDAHDTLAKVMVNGSPNRDLFRAYVGGLIETLVRYSRNGRIRAYGEMVDLLWRDGNPAATLELEELWAELSRDLPLSLLCGYSIGTSTKRPTAVTSTESAPAMRR